jgi:paraquat-inducible protein A
MVSVVQSLPDTCLLCPECDLLVDLGRLFEGRRAECPRCGCVLSYRRRNANVRILVFSFSALICLAASTVFDFIQLSAAGIDRDLTLPQTISVLFALHEWALAAFMGIVVIGLPLAFLAALGTLAFSLEAGKAGPYSFALLRFVTFLRVWNMAEIFFLGILVAMVKIAGMADVNLGPSFWFYGLFNLFLILSLLHVDQYQLGLGIRRLLAAQAEEQAA